MKKDWKSNAWLLKSLIFVSTKSEICSEKEDRIQRYNAFL